MSDLSDKTERRDMTDKLKRYETADMVFQEVEIADEHIVIEVRNKKLKDATVGTIRWYGPWHQYIYLPAPAGLYSGRHLCDIYDVLGRMMLDLKERKRTQQPKPRRAPG